MLGKESESEEGNKGAKKKNRKPCPEFQTGTCPEKGTHVEDEIILMHCCATCLRVKKQKYGHTKAECNRQKALDTKNAPKTSSNG